MIVLYDYTCFERKEKREAGWAGRREDLGDKKTDKKHVVNISYI